MVQWYNVSAELAQFCTNWPWVIYCNLCVLIELKYRIYPTMTLGFQREQTCVAVLSPCCPRLSRTRSSLLPSGSLLPQHLVYLVDLLCKKVVVLGLRVSHLVHVSFNFPWICKFTVRPLVSKTCGLGWWGRWTEPALAPAAWLPTWLNH